MTIRAVPNGIWEGRDKKKWCRMGLVLQPYVKDKPSGDDFTLDLNKWPTQIIDQLSNLRLLINGSQYTGELRFRLPNIRGKGFNKQDVHRDSQVELVKTWKVDAEKLWKDSFRSFDDLYNELCLQQTAPSIQAGGSSPCDKDFVSGGTVRPTLGLDSLVEEDDPSAIAKAITELRHGSAFLSVFTGLIEDEVHKFGKSFDDEARFVREFLDHTDLATVSAYTKVQARGKRAGSTAVQKDGLLWPSEIEGMLSESLECIIPNIVDHLIKSQNAHKENASDLYAKVHSQTKKLLSNVKLDDISIELKSDWGKRLASVAFELDSDADELADNFRKMFLRRMEGISKSFFEQKAVVGLDKFLESEKSDLVEIRNAAQKRLGAFILANRSSGLPKLTSAGATREDWNLRKLSSISNYPRLARFFAFHIDIDIPFHELKEKARMGKLCISADLDKVANGSHKTRTICSIDDDFFRPTESWELASGGALDKINSEFIDGFVNMDMARVGDKGKRFAIQSMDMRAAVESTLRMEHEVSSDNANRVPQEFIDDVSPELRSLGISLIDRGQRAAAAMEQMLSKRQGETKKDDRVILTAGDLHAGIRIDVGIKEPGEETIIWRSANGRDVVLQADIEANFPRHADEVEPNRPWVRDLDEAVTQMPLQIKRSPKTGSNETSAITNSVVQNYEGWSFGLPVRSGVSETNANELPVSILYRHLSLVSSSRNGNDLPNTLVSLKFGRTYYMRGRSANIDGGGLSWREAYDLYRNSDWENNIPTSEGHIFRRFENIRPPLVLLFKPLDREAHASRTKDKENIDGDSLKGNLNLGSQSRHLVVRSFADLATEQSHKPRNEGTKLARRVVVPDEIPVNLADMHDLFSEYEGDWPPPGAFPNLRLMENTGEFPTVDCPESKKNKMDWDSSLQIEDSDHKEDNDLANRSYTGRNSDQVAILERNRKEPANPYYPDPMSQRIVVAWIPDDAKSHTNFQFEIADFYYDTGKPKPNEALAHLIHVARSEIDGVPQLKKDSNLPRGGWSRALANRFIISLPPAAEGKLLLWCIPDFDKYDSNSSRVNASTSPLIMDTIWGCFSYLQEFKNKFPVGAMKMLGIDAEMSGQNPISVLRMFSRVLGDGNEEKGILPPIPNLIPSLSLGVVHAVQKPVRAPEIPLTPYVPDSKPKPELAVVMLDINDASGNEDSRATFANYLQLNGSREFYKWQSHKEGLEAFVAGKVCFHRKSTHRLRGWASWEDYSDSVAVTYNDCTKRYCFKPKLARIMLFDIQNLKRPVSGADAMDEIMIHGSLTGKEGVDIHSPAFKSRQARDFKVTVRAFSRYGSYFKDISEDELDKAFWSESESVDYKMLSVTRPGPPLVSEVIPAVRTKKKGWKGGEMLVETSCVQRVYLERPWYVSGANEKLAIILASWPNHHDNPKWFERRKTIDDFDNDLGEISDIATRWGGDPTELSGQLSDLITPEHFANAEEHVPSLKLKMSSDENGADKFETVSAVLYTPELEAETGRWFCDIEIHSDAHARPFVKFCFARYQKDSLMKSDGPQPFDLRLSSSVAGVWAQVRPKRNIKISRSWVNGNDIYEIGVTGLGYVQKKADWVDLNLEAPNTPEQEDIRNRFDRPQISAHLMGAQDGEREGIAIYDDEENPVCQQDCSAKLQGWRNILGSLHGADLKWDIRLVAPDRNEKWEKKYLLLVEQDLYAADKNTEERIGSEAKERPSGLIRIDLE